MKLVNSLYYASVIIFMTGLVLKIFRTPFHTVILLMAIAGLLVSGIIYLAKSSKEKGLIALISFSFAAALLSVLKFWPTSIVIVFVILGLVLIYFRIKADKNISVPSMLFPTIILLLVITFSTMSKSTRYYFVSIKYNMHIDRDYWTWDKYAWMLNIDGRWDQADQALRKAKEIADDSGDEEFVKIIDSQLERLLDKNWNNFRVETI